jgi:ABC-type sugar transport system ATPase subunit
MIFSTHDELEATAVGDRIGVINEGTIEQIGLAAELYSSPRTAFVARFIGSPTMNLTGCALKQMGDRWGSRRFRLQGRYDDARACNREKQ